MDEKERKRASRRGPCGKTTRRRRRALQDKEGRDKDEEARYTIYTRVNEEGVEEEGRLGEERARRRRTRRPEDDDATSYTAAVQTTLRCPSYNQDDDCELMRCLLEFVCSSSLSVERSKRLTSCGERGSARRASPCAVEAAGRWFCDM